MPNLEIANSQGTTYYIIAHLLYTCSRCRLKQGLISLLFQEETRAQLKEFEDVAMKQLARYNKLVDRK